MKEFVKVVFDCGAKKMYTLWYSEINNGFAKEGDLLICFSKESLLDTYCDTRDYILSEATVVFPVAEFKAWLEHKGNLPDMNTVLDFWNICSDLAFTQQDTYAGDEDDEDTEGLYDTLYAACEEPDAVQLTQDEEEKLAEILTDGLELVRTYIKPLK